MNITEAMEAAPLLGDVWTKKVATYNYLYQKLTTVDLIKMGSERDLYLYAPSYFERMCAVQDDHRKAEELAYEINMVNYQRWELSDRNSANRALSPHQQGVRIEFADEIPPKPYIPLPGTTGVPLVLPPLPEAGKLWKDRRRTNPPEVPPYYTLLGSDGGAGPVAAAEAFNVAVAKAGGNPLPLEEFMKVYGAWRAHWGEMVPEWVPAHAGEDELPRFIAFAKEVGRVTTRRRRNLVKRDTSRPLGPGNCRWSGSLFAQSARGYLYAKVKAAYAKLDENPIPLSPPWRNFEDFVKDVGFPPAKSADNGGRGGNAYRVQVKDFSKPMGKGNAHWVGGGPSLIASNPDMYKRTRYFWTKLKSYAELGRPGEWRPEWNDFRVFANPATGPGPVPATWAGLGSQRPRWKLSCNTEGRVIWVVG